MAANIYPELDWEAAMQELLSRVAAAAEEVELVEEEPPDFSLDPNVLLVLEHFKPKLHDLFRSFACRQLRGPTDAKVGSGTTRLKERTIWKQTQETMLASRVSSCRGTLKEIDGDPSELEGESTRTSLPCVKECEGTGMEVASPEANQVGSSPLPNQVGSPRKAMLPAGAIGFDMSSRGISSRSQSLLAWAENQGYFSPVSPGSKKSMSSRGQWSPSSKDPYTYACGSPTMRNRQSYMSLEQLFSLCKELKIMPDVINRQTVVRIFKRAQCAGSASAHAGSNFGYLTQEAFVDCIGRIGIEAYSDAPYCDEYPEPHEKIHAFLCDRLPGEIRTMRDRFLYGCSGRGPTVQPGYIGG